MDVPQNASKHCPGTSSTEAGKASACVGCPNQKLCSSGAAKVTDPDIEIIKEKLSFIKHKILIMSGKGGVGKSTVTAMLGRALAEIHEVGILDTDVCGPSQPRVLGTKDEKVHSSGSGWSPVFVDENLSVMSIGYLLDSADEAVIWRGPKKNGMIKQFIRDVDWGELDYLLIDTPPGTSDEHLSIAQFLKDVPGTAVIIVTTPQEVSIQDVRRQITFCKKVGLPVVGIIENMVSFMCPKCQFENIIFYPTTGGGEKLSEESNLNLLAKLPLDLKVAKACDDGINFLATEPDSLTAKIFKKIASRIQEYFDAKIT